MMKVIKRIVVSLILAASSTIVLADNDESSQAVDFNHWLIRARAIEVIPSPNSSTITVIGGKVKSISNSIAPELDFNYFFTPHFSTELILATTKHNATAKDTVLGDVKLGSVWVLPPSLTAVYHAFPHQQLNPYVGFGVNYTSFYHAHKGPLLSSIHYNDSFGLVGQAGVDIQIKDNLVFNIDVKKIGIQSHATVHALGSSMKTKVDINPWIIGAGIGYYFN